MSKKKQPADEPLSPGAALVNLRWAKATADDRSEVGRKLAKARKKLSKAKRREIAAKAAEARWAKHRAEKSAVS